MGTAQSLQGFSSFQQYHKLSRKSEGIFFGDHELYTNKYNNKKTYITKSISFNDSAEYSRYLKKFHEAQSQKQAFQVAYPTKVFVQNQKLNYGACQYNVRPSLVVVYESMVSNLQEYVQSQKVVSEEKIWFVLNEISRSIQQLEKTEHYHLYLLPQNILCDRNQNWFLYDGYFVNGDDPSCKCPFKLEFLQQKITKKAFTSAEHKSNIQKSAYLSKSDYLSEDIYCLGFCVLYMMTKIHPKEFSRFKTDRHEHAQHLLTQMSRTKYSEELCNLVSGLIESNCARRFSVKHLRRLLKCKQQQIIKNESEEQLRKQSSPSDASIRKKIEPSNKSPKHISRAISPQLRRVTSQQSLNCDDNLQQEMSMKTLKKYREPSQIIVSSRNEGIKIFSNKAEPLSNQKMRSFRSPKHTNERVEHSCITTPIQKIEENDFIRDFRKNRTAYNSPGYITSPEAKISRVKLTYFSPQKLPLK